MKRIAILGSTGSIGTQALDVISSHSDLFEAYVLTAGNNYKLLIEQARHFQPEVVVIANEQYYDTVKSSLSDLPIKVYAGSEALCDVVQDENVDIVLSRDTLLEKVCGYEYMGETNMIDVYIRYLRSKIDDVFSVKMIQTVRGVGYVIKSYGS